MTNEQGVVSDLKPCPFCGNDPLMMDYENNHSAYWVHCICSVEGPIKATEYEAAIAWNTRAIPC